LLLDFIAAGNLASALHQHDENPERLLLQHDLAVVTQQFSSAEVEFKPSEANARWRLAFITGGNGRLVYLQ
jgi:hypothetical protein